MSKKKSKKKRQKRTGAKSGKSWPNFDPRSIEKTMSQVKRLLEERDFASLEEANAFLQELIAKGEPLESPTPRTPLEQAQDLIYEAWESKGRRRVELAHRALNISKDCADAYVLLAEESVKDLYEAKDLYEQGVKAGERALGSKVFEEEVGHFWDMQETRPYMRARRGLAQCLWWLGEHHQAIEHYHDMLRLNPNDNQGIRYILINWLLEEGRDETAEKLLNQFEGDTGATWLYSRALWIFRKEGASKKADNCLKEALEQNRFVPAYLLGMKNLPKQLPAFIGLGDENEAIEYASEGMMLWLKTAGALEWLAENLLKILHEAP